LQQALVNLALNARDALRQRLDPRSPDAAGLTPHSTLPPITFRLRHAIFTGDWPAFPQNVPPGDYVALEVIDQGCGMPPAVLSQALDPFFTTKDVGQGTGLGLPMVFGIIQGHQGYMTIESDPGDGTCIGLYLPRLATWTQGVPAGSGEWGHVLEPEAMPGHSILVIDDEEAVQDVIRRFLEIAGMNVTCVASGAAALDVLQNGMPFDLIILDVMMPREDATVTFSRIRQRRPHLPVLLCTGLPQDDPIPQILQGGAAGLLRKPFRMNELGYAVKQAIGEAPVNS
jgi:CheY-like chemotaxis protein